MPKFYTILAFQPVDFEQNDINFEVLKPIFAMKQVILIIDDGRMRSYFTKPSATLLTAPGQKTGPCEPLGKWWLFYGLRVWAALRSTWKIYGTEYVKPKRFAFCAPIRNLVLYRTSHLPCTLFAIHTPKWSRASITLSPKFYINPFFGQPVSDWIAHWLTGISKVNFDPSPGSLSMVNVPLWRVMISLLI